MDNLSSNQMFVLRMMLFVAGALAVAGGIFLKYKERGEVTPLILIIGGGLVCLAAVFPDA